MKTISNKEILENLAAENPSYERMISMLNEKETKKLLKEMAWACYEFWANELNTDDDKEVWPNVIKDLENTVHEPFSPRKDLLDAEAKAEFIEQLKFDLGI